MKHKIDLIEIDENLFEAGIKTSDLVLDVDKVSVSLGYRSNEIPDHFYEIIEKVVKEFSNKNCIRAGFKVVDIEANISEKNLKIENKMLNVDKIIFYQLKKSEKAVLFLVSIGSQMEEWSKDTTSNGDSVTGFIIDSVASSVVEEIADLIHNVVREYFRSKELNITNRYSPGYCNWPVKEQKEIFSFFPENFCGVKLTDTALMIPIKSISGIIGAGKNVEYNEYLCDRCGVKDCTQRIYLSRKNRNVTN